jgi:hypothetical protein
MLSFDDVRSRVPKPDRTSDTACGHGVIASDHDHPNAGLTAVLDRVRHIGAGRVLQAYEPDKRQVLVWRHIRSHARLHRAGEHPQTMVSKMLDMGVPFAAHLGIEHRLAMFGHHFAGSGQHSFRRTLDREEISVAVVMHGRHHLAGRVESMLAGSGVALQQRRAPKLGAKARAQQGQLHRIAGTWLARASKRGVVTEHRDFQKKEKLRVAELSPYGAFAALDLDFTAGHPEPPHSHAVFGQCAGFVREDDGCRAERFDRRKALDQRILASHAPHAASESERGHDRQSFRYCRDGQGDRRLDHKERILALGQPNPTDKRGQNERGPDQLRGQARKLSFQRRASRLGLFNEPRYAAKLGGKPGRRYHAHAAAAGECGALEQHRRAIRKTRLDRDGAHMFRHRDRLAGQHRFIGGKI